MKRPTGVIASSIVLGFVAAFELFTVASLTFGAMVAGQPGPFAPKVPAGGVMPNPAMVRGILLSVAFFLLVLAVWTVLTLVGLARLKNWARYSVMVLGGGLVAISLVSLLGLALAGAVVTSQSTAQGAPPGLMRAGLLIIGLFYVGLLAVGVWWLVYFNLRAVKTYFVPVYAVPGGIAAGEPVYTIDANTFPEMAPPQVYAAAPPGRARRVPVGVTVIACLFFFAAVCALVDTALPFPAMVSGFIVSGVAGRVFFLGMAVLSGAIGWGLLRLDNRARIATYVLLAYGVVNALLMMTPWFQHRMATYMDQMYRGMGVPNMISASAFMTWPMMVFSAVVWLAVAFVVGAVLRSSRAAFGRTAAE